MEHRIVKKIFLFAGILSMALTTTKAGWEAIGSVQTSLQSDQQVVILCNGVQVQITPLAENIVHVRAYRGNNSPSVNSFAVIKTDFSFPHHSYSDDGKAITIATKELTVKINRSPCRIAFLTPDGAIINEDDSSKGMAWDGDQNRVWKIMPEGELYYGFGEKTGPLQRRGLAMTDWNYDIPAYTPATDPVYQSIPFFIGMKNGKAYGIFFDNTFRSSFDMGKESDKYYSFGADGGAIDYYFIYGPDPKRVIEGYTELAGKMNLPPKWALGYQQSRWSYYPESRVREIAADFREKKIPCDVIYLDIDYMDGYRCFTWSKKNFPDPQKMIGDLAREGFKIVTIIDPGIKEDTSYWVYQQGMKGKYFVTYPNGTPFIGKVWPGKCAFPDFANSQARAWWGTLYKGLVNDGIRGFWNDMNEPSVFDVPSKTFPLDVRHNVDGQSVPHGEIHNVYGMEMARGTYEGLRKLRPNERPFVLTRAGFAGIQRYAAAWTGDNVSSWEHLAMAIPMCLNFGLSGQPFVGPDIGGFIGNPSGELYARWLEYGVFLPFCRSHSVTGSKNKEPWAYGKEFETINKKSIELRYRLLPFLYTEFYKSSVSGLPIMRPLMLNYPDDKTTYNIDTQFMLGDDLLISPVLEEGATTRQMYLPSGEWYDFWTREKISGGKWMNAKAPIDHVPVFVKAGAVIPMQQVVQYTDESPADPLTFEIFLPLYGGTSGMCYEDDGITFDYQKGKFRTVGINAAVKEDEIVVVRSAAEGSYLPASRSVVFAVNGVTDKPVDVTFDGKKVQQVNSLPSVTEGWNFDHTTNCVSVKLPDSEKEMTVTIHKKR
jgi:alpha-glucosidase